VKSSDVSAGPLGEHGICNRYVSWVSQTPIVGTAGAFQEHSMTSKNYALLAASIFAFIAALQLVRAVGGWPISVGSGAFSVPVWLSWIACVVMAGLAWLGFTATRN
jgi:hypothetical protein